LLAMADPLSFDTFDASDDLSGTFSTSENIVGGSLDHLDEIDDVFAEPDDPDDEDDELGPSFIEPRGISSLIETSDDSDNSDDSEAVPGRVTASQVFETPDSDDDEPPPPPPPHRRKDREKATAEDLASRVIHNIETGEATDAEDKIDYLLEVEVEAQPARKRRRFEDYLDN
jgi:hypothetical protein